MDSQTFDALILGIQNLANPQVIFALVLGAVGGLIIGAVPGIGPAIAIAILLPATIFLDDLVALVLLLGVYGSSMYGGAIPAILINTPGTPVNALTTYDGYSMTRRGQAGRALSLAYSASFFGGMFSICVALIALLGFGPYLRDLGALFGSRDIFMAALLGAVLLVAAHRQNMLIATLMFCVGGLIALVGRSQTRQYNGERIELFTYDLEVMSSGFNLIVVIVGIFAISQALNLLTGKDDDPPEAKLTGGLFRGLTELRKHPFVAACSAAYGTVMGIIPGVGEFVAQFFSYSTARAISKEPEKFGRGAPDGLIASETANNAVPAAAMIPLLALGVPGEALTAMMMVVFFDAGIKPGPDIFENNSDFLFSLFIALMIINVLVLITLLFTTRWVAKMVYIPNRFLGVLILVLAFVGVFSIQNRLEDCIIAAAFGFVGFILRRLDWPLVPIVLGMVLGNIMLERLTAGAGQIVTLAGLFSRWVSGILAVVILGIIIFTIVSLIMERRRKDLRERPFAILKPKLFYPVEETMKKLFTLAAAAVASLGMAATAHAQYPSGPVQFIVPWPPGDFEDILTRMIAAEMADRTGVAASVVNRPGGGDGPFPGALEVLDAPADGSVIGSFVIGVPVVGPYIDIGIEEDSFVPVGIFLTYPFVLAASGDAEYSNMAELAEYAQDNDVVLGHFGAGLAPSKASFAAAKVMDFEFADDAAFDMLDCNTLAAGDADVINTTLALIEPCLGELNILANIGAEPIAKLDGVETLAAQSGINELALWNGLFVKKGTSQEIIDTIAAVAKDVMLGEEAQALAAETGAGVYWQDQAESSARIDADRANNAELNEILAD